MLVARDAPLCLVGGGRVGGDDLCAACVAEVIVLFAGLISVKMLIASVD